ncbi:MAG: tetratricopeptide repeat protein [Gammaproteobacteria bacterium]
MPVAFGLHFIVALFFAIHAMRNGQQMYWLLILFMFPLLGSVVYFVAIYLPNSRLQQGARKVVAVAAKTLDPTRELREARAAFDYTPTAQNQMRLAAALLEAGDAEESAASYEACLKGPFASDLEIRLGAARAYFACNRPADAIEQLAEVRQANPTFRPEEVALLMARALVAAGRAPEAGAEFAATWNRFGSFESLAEYAIWAAGSGDKDLSDRLRGEIQRAEQHWPKHTRELNAPLLRRCQAAYELVR